MSLGNQLGFRGAQEVTTADGMVRLIVMNQGEPLPMNFVYWSLWAPHKVFLRMIGGTSIEDPENKSTLVHTFETVAKRREFLGVFQSGGTRVVDEDFNVDPMIVEVPGIFKRHNPRSIALGTVPRTAKFMSYRGKHSSLFLNDTIDTNVLPNPELDCLMVVQLDASKVLDWDGDVETYFKQMEYLRDMAHFLAVGSFVWNGGGVSAGEARQSLERRFPTLVFRGSGRVSDGLIESREILRQGGTAADFSEANKKSLGSWLTADAAFDVVSYDDPDGLEGWMDHHGFLVPA